MRCPYCGGLDTQVKDSRPTEDASSIRRRRICPDCGGRFTTFERVQLRELHGGQEERPPRAVRPRQARALGPGRAPQAVGRARAGRADDQRRRAPAREPDRRRHSDRADRRTGHGGPEGARRRRLCALRLGLPQFPRGARLQRHRRRARGRARSGPGARRRSANAGTRPLHERSRRRGDRRGPALDDGGAQSRIAVARPRRAQSVGWRDPGQGRGGGRARSDGAGRKAACRADRDRARGRGRARRDALRDARAVLAHRRLAALRRRDHRGRRRPRRVGDGGPESARRGPGARAAARGGDRGHRRPGRRSGAARPSRPHPPGDGRTAVRDAEAGGDGGRLRLRRRARRDACASPGRSPTFASRSCARPTRRSWSASGRRWPTIRR